MRCNNIDPRAKDFFSYNPITGEIIWIKDMKRRKHKGVLAGCINGCGYLQVQLKGVMILGHRLAWYLYNGEDPKDQIDHINGVRNDNRIHNLRVVSHRENLQNCISHREGRLVGASFYSRDGNWRADIQIDGKKKHIGYYETEQEAHEAYVNKLQEVH